MRGDPVGHALHEIAHISHAELLSPTPEESLRFFVDVMGMEIEARGPRDTRTGHHLVQRCVDQAAAPAALVDGRAAQPGELGAVVLAHSSLTTCGMTRWKASA